MKDYYLFRLLRGSQTKAAYLDMSPFALKAALPGLGVATAQWHGEPLSPINTQIRDFGTIPDSEYPHCPSFRGESI
jgi:hypothetical protein